MEKSLLELGLWSVIMIIAGSLMAVGILQLIGGYRYKAIFSDEDLLCTSVQYISGKNTMPKMDSFFDTIDQVVERKHCLNSKGFTLNGKTYALQVSQT